MFKAICSFIGKNKPEICRKLNFKNGKSQDERDNQEREFDYDSPEDMDEARKQFDEYEKTLTGMEHRAKGAEIVLGFLVVMIINCLCFAFCRIHNRKKREDDQQIVVNEQVSQYF